MRVELRRTEASGSVAVWIARTVHGKVIEEFGRQGAGLKSDVHPVKGDPDELLLKLRDKKLKEGKAWSVHSEDLTPSVLATTSTHPGQDELRIWLPSHPTVHDALVMLTAVFGVSIDLEVNGKFGVHYGIGNVEDDLMVRWSPSRTSSRGFARVFVTSQTMHQQLFVAAVATRLRIPIEQSAGKSMGEAIHGEDFLEARRSRLSPDVVALLIKARVLCDGNLLVGAFA